MSPARLLTQRAMIEAEPAEPVQSAAGGVVRSPRTPLATEVPCLVRPRTPSLAARGARVDGRRTPAIAARIYFAGDPLAPGARLGSAHRIWVEGRCYNVVGPVDFNSQNRLVAIDCDQVGP